MLCYIHACLTQFLDTFLYHISSFNFIFCFLNYNVIRSFLICIDPFMKTKTIKDIYIYIYNLILELPYKYMIWQEKPTIRLTIEVFFFFFFGYRYFVYYTIITCEVYLRFYEGSWIRLKLNIYYLLIRKEMININIIVVLLTKFSSNSSAISILIQ